jgi:glycosyltransferase involved in cell wall biosynthesis
VNPAFRLSPPLSEVAEPPPSEESWPTAPDGSEDRRPFVSVVLPAYNEAAIIGQNLEMLCTYMATLEPDYRWEVVVVNDGSSDDTGAIATEVSRRWPQIRVLHHRSNFNIGQALRYAFSTCDGDYVVTLDSDLSYAPSHVGQLLDAIRTTHAKIVIAAPYLRGGQTTGIPRVRLLLSRAANRFLWLATKRQLATLTSMVRVYDRPFLSTLDLTSTDVGLNTEIIYKAQVLKAKICEIPAHLDWTAQQQLAPERRSSLRLTRSVLAYLSSGFLFRPLAFFALPGVALLLLSLYTLAWAAYRVAGHMLSQGAVFSAAVSEAFQDAPHTFIVGGISLLLAVQLISLGIMAAQSKAYFEESFHLGTSIYRRLPRQGPLPDRARTCRCADDGFPNALHGRGVETR